MRITEANLQTSGVGYCLSLMEFPAIPESVPHSRQWIRTTLTLWRLPEQRDPFEQLIAELFANALKHARVGDGYVVAGLTHSAGTSRLEVYDFGDPVDLAPQRPGALDENGRGLLLVEAYADRWGTQSTATGKSVWCELDDNTPTQDGRDV